MRKKTSRKYPYRPANNPDDDLYIVRRLGLWPVTEEMRREEGFYEGEHEYTEEVQRFGPFDHATAKAKAIEIFETSGDAVDIVRAKDDYSIASIWQDGRRMIAQEHDDEGNALPQSEWFSFWA